MTLRTSRWTVRTTGTQLGREAVAALAISGAALFAFAPVAAAQPSSGHAWAGIAMGLADESAGVKVEHVVHGSPAEKAGLRPDDRITNVDGAAVRNAREVSHALGSHAVGETATVTVARAGKPEQLRVVLADFPSLDAMLRMDHVGSPVPAWDGLEPTSGFPASIASLRGRVVVVDFWATWCGPCREVAPVLSNLQARYGAQGLSVVGITTDSAEQASTFKERLGLRYPMASDPNATTSKAYGVSALPTLYVIDRQGDRARSRSWHRFGAGRPHRSARKQAPRRARRPALAAH